MDFVVVSWDAPSGSVIDGYAYDFEYLNDTQVLLPPTPLSLKLEVLQPDKNYTVVLYAFSRSYTGDLLYSDPIEFNFTTCN